MAKVLAALSGGVDSSVAAFLLRKKGFEVIGATFKVLSSKSTLCEADTHSGCCSEEAIREAKRVAQKIGIKHFVFDLSAVFERKVIENFYKEYKKGRTPNPCVRCNQFIKFDALLKKAKQLQADYICTGHYARIQYNRERKRFLLKKARDKTKDQSYFLYSIRQRNLKHILFPLGNLTKSQVRQIARNVGFGNYARKDSQEICFVTQQDYRKFLSDFFKAQTGDIVDTEGKVLGRHKGIFSYTIGQRKGLGLSAERPYYVVAIEERKNRVVIGFEEKLYASVLLAKGLNFIAMDRLTRPLRVEAKVRYKHKPHKAIISAISKNRVKVEFLKPQRAITPGQAVVFYQRDTVLGGGVIERVMK